MSAMRLDLMSMPGDGMSRFLTACAPYLAEATEPRVAYLPAASIHTNYLELALASFAGLATVDLVDTEAMEHTAILAMLDRASLLYIPGGNTFVLAGRLRKAGLMDEIARRVREGLPLVGFSAGSVICGPDILNSNDANPARATDFAGLGLVPFSINVHYPDGEARVERDERFLDYHAFESTPVLALQDDAWLHVEDDRIAMVEGTAWLFDRSERAAGQPARRYSPPDLVISPAPTR
jgi:dipeptidase E